MGTRADFYIGRGKDAEWIGSIAWDGNPWGLVPSCFSTGLNPSKNPLLLATEVEDFRSKVVRFLERREDATRPDQGWPWPWNDSATTDYAYAFDSGKVWASDFGHAWFDPLLPEPEEKGSKDVVFPDMTARKNITLGPRSGLLFIQVPKA